MNDFNFTQWIAIVGPIATLIGVLYLQHRTDWKEMFALWKENQERWLECNLRIEKILARMERNGK